MATFSAVTYYFKLIELMQLQQLIGFQCTLYHIFHEKDKLQTKSDQHFFDCMLFHGEYKYT